MISELMRSPEFVDWSNPVNRSHPLAYGLVAWWMAIPNRMGWGSFTWRDLLGKNHGTLTSMAQSAWGSAKGRRGGFGALNFDGTDDHVLFPNAVISGAVFPGTYSFWIRPDVVERSMGILRIEDSSGNLAANFRPSGENQSDFFVSGFTSGGSYSYQSASNTVAANTWSHGTFTQTGALTTNGGTWYINGVLSPPQFEIVSGSAWYNGDGEWKSGQSEQHASFFDGAIGEILVWNRALSAAQVMHHHRESIAGYPGLLNRIPIPLAIQQAAAAAIYQRSLMLTGVGV